VHYGQLYGHTGELPGFDSFIGCDPKRQITVIVCANLSAGPVGRGTGGELSKAFPSPRTRCFRREERGKNWQGEFKERIR
jgi:hypothetical protein